MTKLEVKLDEDLVYKMKIIASVKDLTIDELLAIIMQEEITKSSHLVIDYFNKK